CPEFFKVAYCLFAVLKFVVVTTFRVKRFKHFVTILFKKFSLVWIYIKVKKLLYCFVLFIQVGNKVNQFVLVEFFKFFFYVGQSHISFIVTVVLPLAITSDCEKTSQSH